MKYLFRLMMVVTILFFSSTVNAYQWEIDTGHTEVGFKIKHIFANISGRFHDFKGDVFFNPDNLDKAKFDFTVKVKSIDTDNGKRDNHLRSKDFFDSDKFPDMTFKSSKITHIKDNLYALEGMMMIKDVKKNIQIEFEYFTSKPHPAMKNKLVAGFSTNFDIPRLDYNVGNGKFLKMGVVGQIANVEISMEALRKQ